MAEKHEQKEKQKEGKDQKKPAQQPVKKKMIEGVRGIVRFAETDLDGNRKLVESLAKVKGIGYSLACAIVKVSEMDGKRLLGSLTEQEIEKLEGVAMEPGKFGIPVYFLNRVSDPFTGERKNLVSSELAFTKKSDIDLMKKMRSYKGVRHELGQPVRGQRTRGNFRTGVTAGVMKGAIRQAAKAATAPAGAPAAGAAPAAGTPAAKGAAPAAAKATAPAKTEEKKK